jgi:hypothetical protein
MYDMTDSERDTHNALHTSMAVLLMLSFTAAINSVVVCGCTLVFGPALGLRGIDIDDVERAVTGVLF